MSVKQNIMLEAMKSYAKTKINETKEQIQQKHKQEQKPKSGMKEDLSIGDELSFGVKHHE